MAWWPFGRQRSSSVTSAGAATAAPPTPSSRPVPSLPDGGWRDLPPLQRTLTGGAERVAIGDHYAATLSAHHDPSFLAPLTHQVDPAMGGLVEDLAAPGLPHARSDATELLVPRSSARPAA